MGLAKTGLLASLIIVVSAGCTDADRARMGQGGPKLISLYSGGKLVKQWHSRNRVLSESASDGWYFVDNGGKLVIVSGAVTIEEE